MNIYNLSEREKSILRFVIHQFILTANPVGSRLISKKYQIGLSAATIRNIMADLEDSGFLGHPHTSAGRVPTDKGYRFYVDSLMEPMQLKKREIDLIDSSLESTFGETDEILKVTSFLLSDITNLIACVTYPKINKSILEKIQLVRLSSSRILIVLTIKSGLVKTITLETNSKMSIENISSIQKLLNQRLSGLSLEEIRKTFKERLKSYYNSNQKPIIRLFIDSADKIFNDFKASEKSIITGAKNLLKQPEFDDQEHFESIIELIEDKDIIIHIMDIASFTKKKDATIVIGDENKDRKLGSYSMIAKEYKFGDALGTLSIIGPKRMHYSKAVAAVIYMAEQLSKQIKRRNINERKN